MLAYLLAPVVERAARGMPFHRRRPDLARVLAIIAVYLAGFSTLIILASLIVPALITETGNLIEQAPQYVATVSDRLEQWNRLYEERVPIDIQNRVAQQLDRFGQQIGAFGQALLNRTFRVTQSMFSAVLGYLVIPFWLFYVLKDRHKIGPAIKAWFPISLRRDVDACIEIWRRVLGSYIRAQLTLGLFIGVITTVGLALLGVPFYVVLGLFAGITELIPVIGPILGAVPAIIVTIATEPGKTGWVILFYVAVQQIENAILVPRVQGGAVKLHPAVIIMLLVIAQQIAGFPGMLVAVPLAAVSRDLFLYVYQRLKQRERELARRAATAGLLVPAPELGPSSLDDGASDAGTGVGTVVPLQ
ncbi:MAG: AI-2E family transporter [Dehalococcoidia bacterium]